MKFYIHDGESQQGPFSKEELKKIPEVNKKHIWHEGLAGWTPYNELFINEEKPPAMIINPVNPIQQPLSDKKTSYVMPQPSSAAGRSVPKSTNAGLKQYLLGYLTCLALYNAFFYLKMGRVHAAFEISGLIFFFIANLLLLTIIIKYTDKYYMPWAIIFFALMMLFAGYRMYVNDLFYILLQL